MERIVILDGYTTTLQDLKWTEVLQLGDVAVYDRTRPEDVVGRCKDAAVVLTNKVVFSDEVMSQLPNLKYIGVLGTGYNVVDIAAARQHGITVTNIPAYSTQSVAQMVFAHILNVTNSIAHYADENRQGRWARSVDFCWMDTPVMEIFDKTIGIIGLGNIGMAVANIAHAFGMKVVAYTSKLPNELSGFISRASIEEVFGQSDFLSLHCPLTDDTREIVCSKSIALMKPGAVVINTGRGPLVNEQDVADALKSVRLGAFCADVLSSEPPSADNPLLGCPSAFITPHIAWASLEARIRLVHIAAQNIAAFLSGNPINVVS